MFVITSKYYSLADLVTGPICNSIFHQVTDNQAICVLVEDEPIKNVVFVPTADFWDSRLQELRKISDAWWDEKQRKGIKDTEENHLPTKEQNDEFLRRGHHWYCHYNGSASNYSLIGNVLATTLCAAR